MSNRLLRLPAVRERCGDSRSTLYLRIQQGLWTRPVPIGPRCVAWPEREVEALVAARIAGHSPEALAALVAKLEAARAGAGAP